MYTILEPLICSNIKSQFLDKKEKSPSKYEKKETPTDIAMSFFDKLSGKMRKGCAK